MPSAFVLFGELKADTNSFKNSLRDAETRLKTTEAAISKTETRAKSLGQSTNVTARSYEKLRDVLNTAKQKLDLTSAAFTKGDATAKQMRSALLGVEAASARMNSRLADTSAKLSDIASKTGNLSGRMQNLGGGMASFGTSLATYVTAPLLLASAALSKIGTSADSLRNKMIAATGSLGGANAKILELRTLAGESAGVFSDAAIDLYPFFKPMKTGEQTINDVIRAFGRLQLADDQFEGKEFGRNLTQLFTQGFEMQDMKQAIGRMPRFGELIAKQFNIEGSDLTSLKEGLNGLKDTGKLTLDQFLQGFATAVNNDQTFGLLADTVGIRFSKALERIKIAVEPLANTLLGVLEPMVEPVAQFVEMLGQKFQALSPSVQTGIVAFLGFAAALGPVIIIVGKVAAALGTIAAAIPSATVILAIAGIAAAIGYLAVAAYGVYQAWQINFGGIQDLTAQIANTVKNVWNSAMSAISQFTNEMTAEMSQWWQANGSDIMQSVNTVSNAVKATWKGALVLLNGFWEDHGAAIKLALSGIWQVVRTVFVGIFRQILNVINLISALINGDWAKVWEVAKKMVSEAFQSLVSVIVGSAKFILGSLGVLLGSVVNMMRGFYGEFVSVGTYLVTGLAVGIRNGAQSLYETARSVISTVVMIMQSVPKVQSPSKVTTEIGQYIVEGLIVGMKSRISSAADMAKGAVNAVLAQFEKLSKAGDSKFDGLVNKKIVESVKELTKQIQDLAIENAAAVKGFTQTIGLRIQLSEGEKLKSQIEELIQLRIEFGQNLSAPLTNIVGETSMFQKLKDTLSAVKDSVSEFISNKPSFQDMLALFSDPTAKKGLDDLAASLGVTTAKLRELIVTAKNNDFLKMWEELSALKSGVDLTDRGALNEQGGITSSLPDLSPIGEVVPEIKKRWEDFFATFRQGIQSMKENLPSLKASLGENLMSSIEGISNVFGNAVANWDGTIRGFFKSVAQGFGQMAKQIIADLIRILVYKAILKLVGSFTGATALGGAQEAAAGAAANASALGALGGGVASSAGGLANRAFGGLSEAVSGFGNGMRGMVAPQMSFAGMGGMMPSSSSVSNNNQSTFNINVSGGGNPRETAQSVTQAIRQLMRKQEEEQRRRK